MSASGHLVRMTLREKCGQMVFMGCAFPDDDPDRTSQLVRKDGVGGLMVLGGSVFDVPSFVNWAQKVAKFPVLVVADFERGARISGATVYPSGPQIAATLCERCSTEPVPVRTTSSPGSARQKR